MGSKQVDLTPPKGPVHTLPTFISALYNFVKKRASAFPSLEIHGGRGDKEVSPQSGPVKVDLYVWVGAFVFTFREDCPTSTPHPRTANASWHPAEPGELQVGVTLGQECAGTCGPGEGRRLGPATCPRIFWGVGVGGSEECE